MAVEQLGVILRLGDACRLLGVHADTIKRIEKKGIIHPYRNNAGVRFLSMEDVEKLKEMFTPKKESIQEN